MELKEHLIDILEKAASKKAEPKKTEPKEKKTDDNLFSYKDENGKTIKVNKIKDEKTGEVKYIKTNPDGSKSELSSTEFSLEISKAKDAAEKAEKEKEAKKKSKEEKQKSREESRKEREEARKSFEESKGSVSKTFDSIFDKQASSDGVLWIALGTIGKLTKAIFDDIAFNMKNKKDKAEAELSERPDDDILTQRAFVLDKLQKELDKEDITNADDETKQASEKAKAELDKLTAAMYNEDGTRKDPEEALKTLKEGKTDEEFEQWMTDMDALSKKADANTDFQKIDKELNDPKNPEKEAFVNDFKSNISETINRHNTVKAIEAEHNKSTGEETERYNQEIENLENEYKENKKGLDNFKADVDNVKAKIAELEVNQKDENKKLSDAEYKSQLSMLNNEYSAGIRALQDETDKIDSEYKDKKEKTEENHKVRQQEIDDKRKEDIDKVLPKKEPKPEENTIDDEDDMKDSDEEIENTEELEDEKTDGKEGDEPQNPAKVWRKKTYKRGDKTMKTKSYYNKSGDSISSDEFKEKMNAYHDKMKKIKSKNESLKDYLKYLLLD